MDDKDKDDKDAILTLHLEAESGYVCDVEHRINLQQWREINKILRGEQNG